MTKTSKLKRIMAIAIIAFFQGPAFGQTDKTNAMTERANYADSNKGTTIHQEIVFKATPQQLYETLLSSAKFSACTKKSFDMFSANSATIEPTAGGTFSVFDGHIIGRTIELVPNQRIVQAWRVADWPAGLYSIVRFELKQQGAGTLLVFDHIGFPEGLKQHFATGWQQHYWDALTKYLP
jgi:activator of HSP90 ATPase